MCQALLLVAHGAPCPLSPTAIESDLKLVQARRLLKPAPPTRSQAAAATAGAQAHDSDARAAVKRMNQCRNKHINLLLERVKRGYDEGQRCCSRFCTFD